jgi:hypothetical protein
MTSDKPIAVGHVVRLKQGVKCSCPDGRENNRSAVIRGLLTDIKGGVFLDRDLHGCRYWNINDLQLVRG